MSNVTYYGGEDFDDDDDNDDNESETGWSSTLAPDQEIYETQTKIRLSGGDMTRMSRMSIVSTIDDESTYEGQPERKLYKYCRYLKITVLFICWMIFTGLLMMNASEKPQLQMLCVPVNESKDMVVKDLTVGKSLEIEIIGPFKLRVYETRSAAAGDAVSELIVVILSATFGANGERLATEVISEEWRVMLAVTKEFDTARIVRRENTFKFSEKFEAKADKKLLISFASNIDRPLPLQIDVHSTPIPDPLNSIVATLLVSGMYVLIIFNIVPRSLAALLTCTFTLSILAWYNQLPELSIIIQWIDVSLLMEIFGTSVIVTIFAKTGIVENLAAKAYEWSNGHIWPMINIMIGITALSTLIFDNITIMMLISPILIRLCEVMLLNPVPVLMCIIIMLNIVSAWTPTGDPPNAVIRDSAKVIDGSIDFVTFVVHMIPGTLLAMTLAYIHLRIQFFNSSKMRFTEGSELERLQRVIKVWRKTATGMTGYSKDEETARDTVNMKVHRLRKRVRRLGRMPKPPADYTETVQLLKQNYPIHNWNLLYQCLFTLLFIIALNVSMLLYEFGIHISLTPGWIALLGALLILILIECDMEAVMVNIEWATLLFIATLFVLLSALDEMDLTQRIANFSQTVIASTRAESRLAVALMVILWTSALLSAFFINLPVTSMMLRIVLTLSNNPDLNLPLQPLVWSLGLGVCLGGNGSIIGAISNIVCVGIAENHGYKFRFMDFFKIGFPIMVGSLIMSTIYLMLAHIVFHWH